MSDNFLKRIEQYKLPIGLCLVGLVLIVGGIFAAGLNKQPKNFPKESLVESSKKISVDVSGAVLKPGVYQLKEGDRVEQAIQAAGGLAENANQEYLSKYLNMAQKLSDGSKIYVPLIGESFSAPQIGGGAGVNTQTKVNINTASQPEIEALPGIGPTTALKIISGRPYKEVEELLNKKVVSKATFEKIKDQVIVY